LIAAELLRWRRNANLLRQAVFFPNEIEENISRSENFAFETTLSGLSYLRLIDRLQRDDWQEP